MFFETVHHYKELAAKKIIKESEFLTKFDENEWFSKIGTSTKQVYIYEYLIVINYQENLFDCGVFLMMKMATLVLNLQIKYSQRDMKYLRQRFLLEIKEKNLLWKE